MDGTTPTGRQFPGPVAAAAPGLYNSQQQIIIQVVTQQTQGTTRERTSMIESSRACPIIEPNGTFWILYFDVMQSCVYSFVTRAIEDPSPARIVYVHMQYI